MADNKKCVILGGGTVSHVRSHLALAAPAYGNTARRLDQMCREHSDKLDVELFLTRMALGDSIQAPDMETPEDVEQMIDALVRDPAVKIVFFNIAMVDYYASKVSGGAWDSDVTGKHEERLSTRKDPKTVLWLTAGEKMIGKIRKKRKDIFLVGFKATCGATKQEQYLAGLNLLKEASCNLVYANDTKTRFNMVITPEEAAYHQTNTSNNALKGLVEMAYLRSHLTFTRSTVVDGQPVSWSSDLVPATLRTVVDHCIGKGAYKTFRGSTVGHFAVKLDDTTFLTSRRKTNFNQLQEVGLVKVKTDGPDSVIAFGGKPSVGGQSQRIVFSEHQDCDCIVHFHCPLKTIHTNMKEDWERIPVVSQREYECGSHQCGQNTSTGLQKFGNLYAVMLDQHGPNIVFNKSIDPKEVIDFIDRNFELGGKTGGYDLEQRPSV